MGQAFYENILWPSTQYVCSIIQPNYHSPTLSSENSYKTCKKLPLLPPCGRGFHACLVGLVYVLKRLAAAARSPDTPDV